MRPERPSLIGNKPEYSNSSSRIARSAQEGVRKHYSSSRGVLLERGRGTQLNLHCQAVFN